jgi:kynurenine formamidase
MRPEYADIVPENSVVLLYTGFDARYGDAAYFTAHPVVGDALAAFLLSRSVKILGMDMPSPDYEPYTFHRALLARGVFALENLTNLGALVGVPEFAVMALPLKLEAEASFTRAVALVRE